MQKPLLKLFALATLLLLWTSYQAQMLGTASCQTTTKPQGMCMDKVGDYIYVGHWNSSGFSSGISIYDNSVPGIATFVSSESHDGNSGSILDMESDGSYLYACARYAEDFYVLDFSNPTDLNVIGVAALSSSPTAIPSAMKIDGTEAYVVDDWGELYTIDISTPTAPSVTNSLTLGANPKDVDVKDNTAYIAVSNGLMLVDITTPTSPVILTTITDAAIYSKVYVDGIYLYASSGPNIYVYDITTPTSPVLMGPAIALANTVYSFDSNGDYLYVGTYANANVGAVTMVDRTNPSALSIVDEYPSDSHRGKEVIYDAGFVYSIDDIFGYELCINGDYCGTNETVNTLSFSEFCSSDTTIELASSQLGTSYYLRDDGNDTIIDGPISGTGSALTFATGSVTSTMTYDIVGTSGGALNFDGVDDYLEVPANASLDFTGDFTIETVFMKTALTFGDIYSQWEGATNQKRISLNVDNSELLQLLVSDDGTTNTYIVQTINPVSLNEWHHVAVTFEAGVGAQIFLNGVLQATTITGTVPASVFATSSITTLGASRQGAQNWFEGSIDEIRVWDDVRTPAEIISNMFTPLSGSETNLAGYWNFEDGTNSTIANDLANGNTATLMSMDPVTDWVQGLVGGCETTMVDKVTITIDSIIDQGVGAALSTLCNNGSTTIDIDSTQVGIDYYLRNDLNDTIINGPYAGLGTPFSFNTGNLNTTTTFNVYATGTSSGGVQCSYEMAQTATVTISNATSGTDVQQACGSYVWIDGNTYTADNNTATHLLTNAAGCDSTVTLNLSIVTSVTGTDVQTACDSYLWIDGNTYTADNNTATHVLTTGTGCDSTVTLNLTITNSTTGIDVQTACDSYLWIDGNTYTADNNTATFILTNAAGCDSTVTLDLTVNSSSTGTDTQAACLTYTWIDGNTYTADNSTATHVLTNAAGCDSTVTLNLTINNSTTGTDVQQACGSYLWIDGNTYTADNNTATHVLTNAAGCDSTVTLNLSIVTSVTGIDVQTACDSYLWIDGNTYTADNNTATHVLTNATGCDSTVTLNLTLTNSTTGVDIQTACDSYVWIDGNTYTSDNNTATHVLTNATGCDSTVTLNLTIVNSTNGTDIQQACGSYVWIDGNTYTADNNTATYVLTNAAGCDSTITLDLTINSLSSSTDVQETCGSFLWIDGNTYTTDNNTATHVLTNAAGCDSIVTLDLTILNVDASVSVDTNAATIIATNVSSGVNYQWIFCATGIDVPNETNQSFTPLTNGYYAVIVTSGTCSETSECVAIGNVGIDDEDSPLISIFPNPTKGLLNVGPNSFLIDQVEVYDLSGKMIKIFNSTPSNIIDISDLTNGIYILSIHSGGQIFNQRVEVMK